MRAIIHRLAQGDLTDQQVRHRAVPGRDRGEGIGQPQLAGKITPAIRRECDGIGAADAPVMWASPARMTARAASSSGTLS
ncbi:hypothetical protein AA16373_1645 [Komagataeibacter swingsii DSM 16373]|nr:hypothetical protein AA16373_1645 [Komagataeibacter swingsii DSM 16373]